MELFQSLDYDQCENDLLVNEAERKGYQWEVRKEIFRWVISVFIGLITGLIAVTINIVIKILSGYKYSMLKDCILFIHGILLEVTERT